MPNDGIDLVWLWVLTPAAIVLAVAVREALRRTILANVAPPGGPLSRRASLLPDDPERVVDVILELLETPLARKWLALVDAERRVIRPSTPLIISLLDRYSQDVSNHHFTAARSAILFPRIPIFGVQNTLVVNEGMIPHTHTLEHARPSYAFPHEIRPRVHGELGLYLPLWKFLAHAGFPRIVTTPGRRHDPSLLDAYSVVAADGACRPRLIRPSRMTHELILGEGGETFALGFPEGLEILPSPIRRPLRPAAQRELARVVAQERLAVIVQIHHCQPHPDAMLPILDTAPSAPRWPGLFVAPDGRARLFVQKTADPDDWERFIGLLREIWVMNMCVFDYGLYDFLRDDKAVDAYMAQKLEIHDEFFLMRDLGVRLPGVVESGS